MTEYHAPVGAPTEPATKAGLRRRERIVRVQLNSKMEINLLDELREYAARQGSTIQDVLEVSVRDYMDAHPVAE